MIWTEFKVTTKSEGTSLTEDFVIESITDRLRALGMYGTEVKVKLVSISKEITPIPKEV